MKTVIPNRDHRVCEIGDPIAFDVFKGVPVHVSDDLAESMVKGGDAEYAAEPVAETPAEPVAEAPAEPVAETPAEPVAETPAEPVAETPAATGRRKG